MYFIELILKKLLPKPKKEREINFEPQENPEIQSCEHIFMPIDSTGETLACSKCGLVVHKKDLYKHNPFSAG